MPGRRGPCFRRAGARCPIATWPVPDHLDVAKAALTEPLAVSLKSRERSKSRGPHLWRPLSAARCARPRPARSSSLRFSCWRCGRARDPIADPHAARRPTARGPARSLLCARTLQRARMNPESIRDRRRSPPLRRGRRRRLSAGRRDRACRLLLGRTASTCARIHCQEGLFTTGTYCTRRSSSADSRRRVASGRARFAQCFE